MIRHFVILKILLLSATIRESIADRIGPSITGKPSELNDERAQRLKGALRGRQNDDIDVLPVAMKGGGGNRKLQNGGGTIML